MAIAVEAENAAATLLHLPLEAAETGSNVVATSTSFADLTIDNPDDVDYYQFTLAPNLTGITIASLTQDDGLTVSVWEQVADEEAWETVGGPVARPILFVPDRLDEKEPGNDTAWNAYYVDAIENVGVLRGLTLDDQGHDQDWFAFDLTYSRPATLTAGFSGPADGVLTGDAHFQLQVGEGPWVSVTVPAVSAGSLDGLVAHIQTALADAGLGERVVVGVFLSRLTLAIAEEGSDESLALRIPALADPDNPDATDENDPAATELGLVHGQTALPPASITLERVDGGGTLALGLYASDGSELEAVSSEEKTLRLDLSGEKRGRYLLKVAGSAAARYELRPAIGAPATCSSISPAPEPGIVGPDRTGSGQYVLSQG